MDRKEYYKNYNEQNKEKRKLYNEQNKEKRKAYNEQNKEKRKAYYEANKEKIKKQIYENIKKRYANDFLFKLKSDISSMIRKSIKNSGFKKLSRTEQILGCSYEDFKLYLESKFEDWMTWENKGNPKDGILEFDKTWDIDHIIPVTSATTEIELIKLNHYTNLQPLCSKYNREIKKNNI